MRLECSKKTVITAIERFVDGESARQISMDLGCSVNSVLSWVRKYYLPKKDGVTITLQQKDDSPKSQQQ